MIILQKSILGQSTSWQMWTSQNPALIQIFSVHPRNIQLLLYFIATTLLIIKFYQQESSLK